MKSIRKTNLFSDVDYIESINIFTPPPYHNMYIMRSEVFHEYMTFFFQVIDAMREKMQPPQRFWGHCAERLINLFLYVKKVKS